MDYILLFSLQMILITLAYSLTSPFIKHIIIELFKTQKR